MMLAGDEMGRTQRGNNNAYCQDNEISWVDWSLLGRERDLVDFTRALSALRRDHPVFRRRRFFRGHQPGAGPPGGPGDIVWLTPAGKEVTDGDWRDPGPSRCRSSSTATRSASPIRAASASPTTGSCCCSTRTTSRSRSPCRG